MDVKLAKRLTFGSLLSLALVGGLIYEGVFSTQYLDKGVSGFFLALVILAVGICCILEFKKFAAGKGIKLFAFSAIVPLVMIIVLPFHRINPAEHISLAIIVMLCFALAALQQIICRGVENAISNIAVTVFSLIYIGFGGYFLLQIRLLDEYAGTLAGQSGGIITFLAVVKGTDIGAYLIGRKFGKHKIIPSVSPGKSWEGLVGGIIFSVAIAIGLGFCLFGLISIYHAVIFGLALCIYGQFGDLVESAFKRDAGLKDSASLIPEFGGFLDLIDSPFFAAPLGWILLRGMISGWSHLLF